MAVRSYLGLLMALGEIGLGWLLVYHSQSMIGFFNSGKKRNPRLLVRILVICGWTYLIFGCLSITVFLILGAIALGSHWR
jgi:hypothetical protein